MLLIRCNPAGLSIAGSFVTGEGIPFAFIGAAGGGCRAPGGHVVHGGDQRYGSINARGFWQRAIAHHGEALEQSTTGFGIEACRVVEKVLRHLVDARHLLVAENERVIRRSNICRLVSTIERLGGIQLGNQRIAAHLHIRLHGANALAVLAARVCPVNHVLQAGDPFRQVVTLRNHAEDLFEVIIHGGLLPLLLNMLRRIDGTGQR